MPPPSASGTPEEVQKSVPVETSWMEATHTAGWRIHATVTSFIYKNIASTLCLAIIRTFINTYYTGLPGNTPGNREIGYPFCDKNNEFGIILNLRIVQCQNG